MSETKEKIENFVDEVIKNNDYELLDVLWIFSYSIPSESGYHENKEAFKKWFSRVCVRNLQKKHNLKIINVREKMTIFANFLNSMPIFLSKETFDEDNQLLRNILIDKTSKILVQNAKIKLEGLSDLNKKVLSFTLNYIPIRIQDSIKEAERIKQENQSYEDKYSSLSNFNINASRETGKIIYFEIVSKKWTYIFNVIFDEELKEQRFKTESYRQSKEFISLPQEQYKEYSFWQFGDELVKIGMGYWTFSLSSIGNVGLKLITPNFIYENLKDLKDKFPRPEDFEKRINDVEKEKAWNFEDIAEPEVVSDVPEYEIEKAIISNPEILEEGLELIGNQYKTGDVGYIDILCKDKNGNFVVIELKRGNGSHKVVGQIQKYMAWINENKDLAQDKQVRGIIVVKEHDKGLEYATKGSKYPIEIKLFGQEPPTEENIKYCTNCGKQLPKSAKFCDKCGKDVWL